MNSSYNQFIFGIEHHNPHITSTFSKFMGILVTNPNPYCPLFSGHPLYPLLSAHYLSIFFAPFYSLFCPLSSISPLLSLAPTISYYALYSLCSPLSLYPFTMPLLLVLCKIKLYLYMDACNL